VTNTALRIEVIPRFCYSGLLVGILDADRKHILWHKSRCHVDVLGGSVDQAAV
jgi:hypothetical protein